MKKLLSTLIIFTFVFALILPIFTYASSTINVTVNGKLVQLDQKPIIDQNNRTLVPIRFISEELGAKVDWNDATQQVTITKGSKVIELTIGKTTAKINGTTYQLDTKPIVKNGRTLVPVRFIAEALGTEVKWDANTRTVAIKETIEEVKITYPIIPKNNNDMIKLVESLPSFSGSTMIGINSGNVVVNLKGSDNLEDLTISIATFEEPIKAQEPPMTIAYDINIFTNQPTVQEKAFIKDILKVFYPTQYEKAYQYFVNKERVFTTLDNRQFSNIVFNDSLRILIGE